MINDTIEPLLEIRGLNAGYGGISVLKEVTFTAGRGEIVAILGANGAGKSTLLKAISGSANRHAGSIHLAGRPLSANVADTLRAGVAHVPEGRRIFPELTVLENLVVGSSSIPRKEVSGLLDETLDLFPKLRERSQQLAGMMSGGEQQLLAIARGLMSRPSILMVDEPSLGLAPMTADIVFSLLTDLNGNGLTVIVVEQRIEACLKMAHHGFVFEQGRLVMSGTGDELLKDEHVAARYLGVSAVDHE